jgi:hypothetical protein
MYGPASVSPNVAGQYVNSAAPAPANARVAGPSSAARKKRKKKKAGGGVPNIHKYLAGDTTFQDQRSQLMRQLEQFRTSNASQRAMVGQDFTTAADKMARQKELDHRNMTGDYAARGLLNSGLFVKSVGDYDTDYQSNYNDLTTGNQRSISELLEALSNYQTESSSSLAAAKQDAIRRRAQKYGITTG